MRAKMFIPLILLAGTSGYIAATVVNILEAQIKKHEAPPAVKRVYEFVCYTDDKLTERHVGVVSAIQSRHGDYSIRYVEGTGGMYRQLPGEICGLEHVP